MIDGTLPLCENEFDIEDATVICRQLNMSFVSYLTRNSKFGNTSQSSGMSLSCIGTESAISECIRKENVDCGIGSSLEKNIDMLPHYLARPSVQDS